MDFELLSAGYPGTTCLYLHSIFCNCLGVDRRRQREKQLLSVDTKQQEPKADSLCLLGNIRAFVGGV